MSLIMHVCAWCCAGRGGGELSEIFQWKGKVVPKGLPDWDDDDKEHMGEELADVLLYLVRLSDMCGVDLGKAALRKMEINSRKYPVGQCKGSLTRTSTLMIHPRQHEYQFLVLLLVFVLITLIIK